MQIPSPACSVFRGWHLNLQRHIVTEWAACLLAVTWRHSVWILLTLFPGGHQRRRENKKMETSEPCMRSQPHKKWGKQSAGPWGKAWIRVLSYHEIPQLNYSYVAIIFYLLFDSEKDVGVKVVLWSLEMLAAGSGNKLTKNIFYISSGCFYGLLWLLMTATLIVPFSFRTKAFFPETSRQYCDS